MTVIEIIDAFTFYGADVLLLAALTALTTQILKVTVLKKVKKKVLTFLPFVLGTLFYAVYAGVRNLSFTYLLQEYVSVIEHGVAVGAMATLAYVMYEQFIRDKKAESRTQSVIATLIDGYVPEDSVEKVAKEVAEAIEKDVTGNGASKTEEILAAYSSGEVTEKDIKLLSRLIIETLAHIATT